MPFLSIQRGHRLLSGECPLTSQRGVPLPPATSRCGVLQQLSLSLPVPFRLFRCPLGLTFGLIRCPLPLPFRFLLGSLPGILFFLVLAYRPYPLQSPGHRQPLLRRPAAFAGCEPPTGLYRRRKTHRPRLADQSIAGPLIEIRRSPAFLYSSSVTPSASSSAAAKSSFACFRAARSSSIAWAASAPGLSHLPMYFKRVG